MNKNKLNAYEIVHEEELSEIHSYGTVLRHKKTGARVMAIENTDENKVFTIGFRTPPKNSTGVAHILEHSVLCGSKAFPLKDPFVELVKGSLNTFLNAMTYPDKTIYPVASCNDQDFQNLMHVYLDAVFYPNIYKNEEIFKQEGWNYHIEDPEGPLTYNGVVYNEMKGAFSSADEVFEREIQSSLYPDNAYSNESGGDPQCIPDLTYEAFLDFHRKYYHPSNSYIYLYGDMDMAEKLAFIDKNYLSAFDRLDVDSAIEPQKAFDSIKDLTGEYSISETDDEKDNTYLSYNMVIDSSDPLTMTAFEVIDYALLSAPGAPLKQALMDAGIGKEVYGYFDDGIMQPYFIIAAKGTEASRKEEFKQIILNVLSDTVKNGINQKSVMAGINSMEFRYREADFGAYPKGLMYGLDILDTWLYTDEEPFINVKQLSVFAELKKAAEEGLFEKLIQKYLIDNTHGTMLTLLPKKGLNNRKEKDLAEKLEALRASLSREDLEKMIRDTKALAEFQETPDSPELLKCLPMLQREDIKKEARKFVNEAMDLDGTPFLFHDVESNGIGYYDLMLQFRGLNTEEVHYLGLLKSVLGYIDTKNYSYGELVNEININSGGIAFGVETFENPKYENGFMPALSIRLKGLYAQTGFLFEMVEEILSGSRLEDKKRLKEIISEIRSSLQVRIASSGHSSAVQRAFTYSSKSGLFHDEVSGIGYLEFIERLDRGFETLSDEIVEKLTAVLKKLAVRKNLLVDYSGEKDSLEQAISCVKNLALLLPDHEPVKAEDDFTCIKKNEGIKTPGQVQYVAQVGNFKNKGLEYTGTLDILKVIMNYGYLWENIRVKGGAYGCMSGFKRNGESYFASYRDPKLAETFEVYKGIPEYVANFKADEREMTKYIIGTISGKDIPLTPHMLGSLSKSAYFNDITEEQVQKERDQILNASEEEIRALAPIIEAVLADQQICVLGSEGAVENSAALFGEVRSLSKEEE